MLTIVDDFSRSTWTFLLVHKTQVVPTLKDFFKMVKTQFERKVKIIRTDNGTEFTSSECQSLLKDLGFIH